MKKMIMVVAFVALVAGAAMAKEAPNDSMERAFNLPISQADISFTNSEVFSDGEIPVSPDAPSLLFTDVEGSLVADQYLPLIEGGAWDWGDFAKAIGAGAIWGGIRGAVAGPEAILPGAAVGAAGGIVKYVAGQAWDAAKGVFVKAPPPPPPPPPARWQYNRDGD